MVQPIPWQPVPTTSRPLAETTFVALHGRGQSPAYIRSVIDRLHLSSVRVEAPAAPEGSWYPHPFMAEIPTNQPWLGTALDTMQRSVDALATQGRGDADLVLVGFSQGACLLSEFVLRAPRRYRAVVLLTGGYLGPPGIRRDFTGDLARTPVLLSTVELDAWVPVTRVTETADAFRRLGADVQLRIQEGDQHDVSDQALADIHRLLHATEIPRKPHTNNIDDSERS